MKKADEVDEAVGRGWWARALDFLAGAAWAGHDPTQPLPLQYSYRIHIGTRRAPAPDPAGPVEKRPIVRVWRGRTRARDADRYLAYLRRTGLADYRRTAGNLAVEVHRRVTADVAEFLVLSWWENRDAITAFAKSGLSRAVYYPQDRRFLLELEPEVHHYELVHDTTAE